MKEYFINFWGGDEDVIDKKFKLKGARDFWFTTLAERETFKARIQDASGPMRLASMEVEGELTHKRTIAKFTLEYAGKQYRGEYDFGFEYPADGVIYMFREGNYACDCNKSIFIARDCGVKDFPAMDCGDAIDLVKLEIEYR